MLYSTIISLFALHYILIRGARSPVQTEQAMPYWAWGWAAIAAANVDQVGICGTVVCSTDVFFI